MGYFIYWAHHTFCWFPKYVKIPKTSEMWLKICILWVCTCRAWVIVVMTCCLTAPNHYHSFFSLPEKMSTHQLLEIQSNTFSVEILSIPYRIYFKVMFQTDDHLFRDQWGTPNCRIEVYACLFILQLLPPWTHLIRACTISSFRSNAIEHVNWAYCGISRLVLAVDML